MHRSAAAAAVIVPLLAVPLVPMASASAAAPYKGANTAAVQDDFNGDGYRDLVIGAPFASNGKVSMAGAVDVLYGSASSVSPKHRTVITQASPGIPGTPEKNDAFGMAVASADLDRDGYADLLVGAPYEKVGDTSFRGSVTVVWGGPDGLSGGAVLATTPGFEDMAPQCQWGMSLSVGDMNGDGAPEVSTASRCGGTSYTGPFTRDGEAVSSVHEPIGSNRSVVMGDVDGDGKAERFWLGGPATGDLRGTVWVDSGQPGADGVTVGPEPLDLANGLTGRIGDVNGDGYGDLVTGVPDDGSFFEGHPDGAAHRGGEIEVLYGSAQGITADQQPQVIHQDSAGVPGSGEDRDRFGESLSVGDVDGDGYADVVVGAPDESIGKAMGAGMVVLLHGSAAGLTGAGAVAYTQNVAGVPGTSEYLDGMGEAVHLADLTGDGRPEMVVGVAGENDGDGCVWVTRGSASGPVLGGSFNLGGASSGITADVPMLFGEALA